MPPSLPAPFLIAFLTVLLLGTGPGRADAPVSGRFLFAGDDDWDWATPLGAAEPCKLSRYGAMPWSALDWLEEGLADVRGALVGTAPDADKTLSVAQLSDLRGERATYAHHGQAEGVITRLLAADAPPNVIILMQNQGQDGALVDGDVAALCAFVKAGGRLLVLDDWKKYPPVLAALVEAALTLPPGPALPALPVPERPDPDAPPAELKKAAPDPDDKLPAAPDPHEAQLAQRFAELVPQLGAEEFRDREAASTAIRELGPGVLALLKTVTSDDPEVAARLAAIREALTPRPARKPVPKISREQQLAQRLAKLAASAKLVTDAETKLKAGKASHDVSTALVDGDRRLLPVLRLSFPPPQ